MEVGAVKHALNNEIIHIKKKLNQTKIQLIHKLTRKAKTLKTPKKTPEHLQKKLERKADAAVSEVLLIKKVQAKDLVRFAIDHKGTLKDYINKPTVTSEKVYAKILLHKTMVEKYNGIRERFGNMPVDELMMTRKERLKLKKERQEAMKQMDNIGKNKKSLKKITEDQDNTKEKNIEITCDGSNDEIEDNIEKTIQSDTDSNENEDPVSSVDEYLSDGNEGTQDDDKCVKETGNNDNIHRERLAKESTKISSEKVVTKTGNTKAKPKNKKTTKKLNPRNHSNTSAREVAPAPAMVVDSFFLTTSGENYMTLAEPRQPDEVKEVHQRGNRKVRRAEMFGKPIKFRKPTIRNRDSGNDSSYKKDFGSRFEKPPYLNSKKEMYDASIKNNKFVGNKVSNDSSIDKRKAEAPVEKLHPSWEAKKQKSGIVAFQGKKVVF